MQWSHPYTAMPTQDQAPTLEITSHKVALEAEWCLVM